MSHPSDLCGPCISQQKKNFSTKWCIQCDECLCASCIEYHKALTITRDHTIVNREERDIVVQFTESIITKCTEHTDSDVEYYCQIHDVPCCRICKVKTHSNCSGVIQINECNDASLDLKSNVEGIGQNIRFLDTMIENRNTQINILKERSDTFSIEMKRTKAEILSRLDSIESSLTDKFSVEYEAEYQKLQNDKDRCIIKQKHLIQRQDQLLKIVELETLSTVQRFLGSKTVMAQNEKEENEIKSDAKSLTNVFCAFDLSCWQLLIKDDILFQSLPFEINLEANAKALDQSKLEELKTADLMTSKKTQTPGIKSTTLQSKEDRIANTTGSQSQNNAVKNIGFTYKSLFCVFPKESTSSVQCLKIISNGNIVLGEVSRPTLFVYNNCGLKLGQVKLNFQPGEITETDNSTVAVTVHQYVVVVDTVNFKITNTFNLNERCYGIAFINNNFVVNCEFSGFKVVSITGKPISKLPFTNALLRLSVCKENLIGAVKYSSELVHFFNIKTQQLTSSCCAGLFGAAGITADSRGNIFTVCNISNKVYMQKAESQEWITILNKTDKIENPVGIDYDSQTDILYVLNNSGSSIYAYDKQRQW